MTTIVFGLPGWNLTGFRNILLEGEQYNWLVSYYWLNQLKEDQIEPFLSSKDKGLFFLDSGAYSAWKSGVKINLFDYIAFINKWQKYFTHVVCLDVIDNPINSEVNHLIMRQMIEGVEIIPVFHSGESFKVLDYFLKQKYSYIGISPNNKWSIRAKRNWMNRVSQYQLPSTHGFGYTEQGLRRYSLTTADSTSWMICSANGLIILPEYGYISISDKAVKDNAHYLSLPKGDQAHISSICEAMGLTVEELQTSYKARNKFNLKMMSDIFASDSDKVESIALDLFDEGEAEIYPFDVKELNRTYRSLEQKGYAGYL